AEDGIRDRTVTGVQTCALPISVRLVQLSQKLEEAITEAIALRAAAAVSSGPGRSGCWIVACSLPENSTVNGWAILCRASITLWRSEVLRVGNVLGLMVSVSSVW